MVKEFGYKVKDATKAFEMEGYYIWDCSVVKAKGKYHLFCSRWKEEYGFGWNWIFNSEIIRAVSDKPEGPYTFSNVVLPRRGRQYFDGLNTHNTCIKEYNGKYYLYYMGSTTGGGICTGEEIPEAYAVEVWNRKRIGLAIADDIDGEFVRRDAPILEPRDCSHWDCTITTNPCTLIQPNGKTYMIYKSRSAYASPLQLGIAVADHPEGKYERLTDNPILQFDDKDKYIEDPFIWYDEKRKKFCLIAKDDCRANCTGVTGEYGNGFYAESDDCIDFEIAEHPLVYTRTIQWTDGRVSKQPNLERPFLLMDDNGVPSHIFCASGDGDNPYCFQGRTYVVCMRLEKK